MSRKLALAAFLLALGVPAFAQRTTGDILGTVKDESGAVLPGVTVSISGPNIVGAQDRRDHGERRVPDRGLPPGTYSVSYSPGGLQDPEPARECG